MSKEKNSEKLQEIVEWQKNCMKTTSEGKTDLFAKISMAMVI